MTESVWRKPKRCSFSNCLEVMVALTSIEIRNSTRPEDTLTFPRAAFRIFVAGIKYGDFAS